ncbi:hypothetical protein [Maribellus sp. YY47]|uniref:hypothetical protein n=1 Tax=Maribellus sp. YY47 TaxID=2929486 RepID=UPI002001D20E|nr:hypothetical protein [Maribellus sp. YY47]MCK3686371.1 hypothetical protein [Maribellus sp. YY47]
MKTRFNHFIAMTIFAVTIFAGNVNASDNRAKASSHDATVETSLAIENWMTDESVWNVQAKTIAAPEAETELQLESWMTDEKAWKVSSTNSVEKEGQLTLENWMIDNSYWKI